MATADWDDASKSRLSGILKQLYPKARNAFYHGGEFASEVDIVTEYLKRLGKADSTLDEELASGEPRLSGVFALENLLRLIVLQRLAEVGSAPTTGSSA